MEALKERLKGIPGLLALYRALRGRKAPPDPMTVFSRLSTDELLSLIRHDAHRIEKSIYNDIFEAKRSYYLGRRRNIEVIHEILRRRNVSLAEPSTAWTKQIHDSFESLKETFIEPNSTQPFPFDPAEAEPFVRFLRARRSARVWASHQPPIGTLERIAYLMIDAARWAPTSGNRQPWRFLIMTRREEKELLAKIKEEHCVTAPLLIFVGMDTRVYGALGKEERGIYIDAGAAAMQMVLLAHKCGLGVCWNHFADDLINSRQINRDIYRRFAETMGIADWIAPVAIVAIGAPEFLPPEPARMAVDRLLIHAFMSAGIEAPNGDSRETAGSPLASNRNR